MLEVYYIANITTMSSEKGSKINRLLKKWPPGTVAVLSWLEKQGISQQLAQQYVKTDWLNKIGFGAYFRSGDVVKWTGGIYAIQNQLHLPIYIGGKTALELRGLSHFVSQENEGEVYIFGHPNTKLPLWFARYNWQQKIKYKMPLLFDGGYETGITKLSIDGIELLVSTPERAIMEVLHLVPLEQGYEESFLLMENLTTLRPKLVQKLLETCRSIKIRRLFLHLAERCNHAWIKNINVSKISLGKGKRVIVKAGHLDPKYQITVPVMKTKDE